jgi:hypothetical protein
MAFVKLDIEGAEAPVIEWMLEPKFYPRQLLVEFDELSFPTRTSVSGVKNLINRLLDFYALADYDGRNYAQ